MSTRIEASSLADMPVEGWSEDVRIETFWNDPDVIDGYCHAPGCWATAIHDPRLDEYGETPYASADTPERSLVLAIKEYGKTWGAIREAQS